MVDRQSLPERWEGHGDPPMTSYDRVQCIEDGMGSTFIGDMDRRSLDKLRTTQHKLSQAPGGISSAPYICVIQEEHADSYPPQQCDSDCIPQQDGRPPFRKAFQASHESMEVVSHEEHVFPCRTSASTGES